MINILKVENIELAILNLASLSANFKFDIRYSRSDNFMKEPVYPSAHAFLLEHVALDLKAVHDELLPQGYGLLIFDGYRPWSVTKLFWDKSNDHDRQFLADPDKGSSHNRGCAVDLSLYELKSGSAVVMPSDFDEMNEKAHIAYTGSDAKSSELRDLLQSTMRNHHFTGIKNEWWHFNHVTHADWPVMNFTFAEILQSPAKSTG